MNDVLRLLGAETGHPRRAVLTEQAGRFESIARSAARPAAVWNWFKITDLPDGLLVQLFPAAAGLALAVVTIGPALEAEVTRLAGAGSLSEAAILDAWGSELAEAAARATGCRLGATGAAAGFIGGGRSSPGYGKWPLEGQDVLFRLLPAGEIGVQLTGSRVMVPRKSVSFGMPFYPAKAGILADSGEASCAGCTLENCRARRPDAGENP